MHHIFTMHTFKWQIRQCKQTSKSNFLRSFGRGRQQASYFLVNHSFLWISAENVEQGWSYITIMCSQKNRYVNLERLVVPRVLRHDNFVVAKTLVKRIRAVYWNGGLWSRECDRIPSGSEGTFERKRVLTSPKMSILAFEWPQRWLGQCKNPSNEKIHSITATCGITNHTDHT